MEGFDKESYLNKFRPAAQKSGRPRNERDEQLDIFVARLNASRIKDGYPKLSHGHVAKMLDGTPTAELHSLYKRCETYRAFGAGLKHQLSLRA